MPVGSGTVNTNAFPHVRVVIAFTGTFTGTELPLRRKAYLRVGLFLCLQESNKVEAEVFL